jgi:hypothetical protein
MLREGELMQGMPERGGREGGETDRKGVREREPL